MQNVKDFCVWFIGELPAFLMAEPICYFVGFFFAFVTVSLIRRLMNIS